MLISTGFPSLSYSYNLLRLSVCFPIQLILLHGGTTIYKRFLDIQSLSLSGGPRDPWSAAFASFWQGESGASQVFIVL